MKRAALAVAAVAVLTFPATVLAADTITITPMEGPPGTEVNIELQADHQLGDDQYGINFQRYIDDAEAFIGADPFSFDESGFARVTFVVPDVEPGFYELVMSCLGDCEIETIFNAGESAGIGFTVTQAVPNTAMSIPGVRGVVTGGPAESAEIVFRVTLQGPVDPTHTFAVRCGTVDPGAQNPCFGESIWPVCTVPDEFDPFDDHLSPCAAGTYEIIGHADVGQTIEYGLLRWTSLDLSHTDTQPEEHLRGSWVVQQGRQVISLGFDYSGGALPDTALSPP